MERPRTATVFFGLLALMTSTAACSSLKPFRVKGIAEVAPEPAAARTNADRESAKMLPFALAREDDYVVRVVAAPREIAQGSLTCSGTLIDEDQVLTAHHCIAERNQYGDYVAKNLEPNAIRVELGGDDLPWGEVGVKAIVSPPCGHGAGDGDIAILVLERRLIGIATAKPRLDEPPTVGEPVDPVGFGRCALSAEAIHRRQRAGGRVDRLLDSRFRLDASICPGDSGGPAISGTSGEVVGVVSAAVMDGSEQTIGRAEFTRLDRWRSVFATAKLISEGTSPSELPPVEGCPGQ